MLLKRLRWVVTGACLCSALSIVTPTLDAQAPADNTKVNKADRAKGAVTADQQKDNAGDRELTRKIRRALTEDKALSSYAHNVKVIAQAGQVTLKGPVRSEEEKRIVEAKATEVAGAGHVTDQMTVAPTRTSAAKNTSATKK